MREYFKFSKSDFEFLLKGILIQNKIGFLSNITDDWLTGGNETWEHIYKITTRNKSVDIIIFSSLDMRTNQVRDIGGDAVRVVMRWTTKNGPVYRHIAKHYRLKTLFENLERTLLETQGMVFKLNYKEFTPAI